MLQAISTIHIIRGRRRCHQLCYNVHPFRRSPIRPMAKQKAEKSFPGEEAEMPRVMRVRVKRVRSRTRMKRRRCLRCDREFLSEGPHNRLCQPCREFLAGAPTPMEEYPLGYL
jgi:hypothetical protein